MSVIAYQSTLPLDTCSLSPASPSSYHVEMSFWGFKQFHAYVHLPDNFRIQYIALSLRPFFVSASHAAQPLRLPCGMRAAVPSSYHYSGCLPFIYTALLCSQVTASTAVLMILFSSSSIALSLAFQGLLNASYAEVFAPLCFVFSLIGVTVVGRIVRKSGHTSIIVLILTGLIIAGTVLTAVFGGLRSIHSIRAGHDIAPRPFCQS